VTTAGWNVLLYAIAGDHKEHERVISAIADMHDTLTTSECNVAVQLHAKSKTTRHWISKGRKVQTETLPIVVDASEPASLTSFLNAANRTFPARSSALMLWAHSSGLDHLHDYPKKKKKAHRQPGLDSVFGEQDSSEHSSELGGGVEIEEASVAQPGSLYQPVFGQGSLGHDGFGRHSFGHHVLDQRSPGRPERYGCRWGPDPNTHQFLTNVGMKKAILASARQRVEVLGLNACWMASLEVEYELRNVSDVQIASQVSANPWPYGAIIATLAAAPDLPAEQLAQAIVASVRSEIMAGKRKDAISALLSGPAMDELATAFDAYAKRAMALLESDWEAVSKAVMVEAQRVDDPYQVDLMSLIHELGKHDLKAKIAAASVASKYRAMLLANAASATHPGVHGLSIFCPKTTHVDLGDAYRGTDFRTNTWAQFLKAFQIKLARTPVA
jgi:Clostripain family